MHTPSFNRNRRLFVKQTDSCYQCPDLLQNLVDLGYIRYDEDAKTLWPTETGHEYLKNHHDTVKYLIEKYDVPLTHFGALSWAFDHFYKEEEDRKSLLVDSCLVAPDNED